MLSSFPRSPACPCSYAHQQQYASAAPAAVDPAQALLDAALTKVDLFASLEISGAERCFELSFYAPWAMD